MDQADINKYNEIWTRVFTIAKRNKYKALFSDCCQVFTVGNRPKDYGHTSYMPAKQWREENKLTTSEDLVAHILATGRRNKYSFNINVFHDQRTRELHEMSKEELISGLLHAEQQLKTLRQRLLFEQHKAAAALPFDDSLYRPRQTVRIINIPKAQQNASLGKRC